jgi:hypothetical protein
MSTVFFKTVWRCASGLLLSEVFFEFCSVSSKDTHRALMVSLLFVNGGEESSDKHFEDCGGEVVAM